MASSRRARRLQQQQADRRHRMRLERLEERRVLNAAPVLDDAASPTLGFITEDAAAPTGAVGTLVSSLVDSGGPLSNFSDVDGDLPGIAITGVNLQGGSLWYSADDGTTWLDVGAVSDAAPRLLAADLTTRIYFQPAADFSGTISDVISFKAWDRNVIWQQIGLDIDGEAAHDAAGYSVSISADGQTVAIGAPENDGNGSNSGHVRIYNWTGSAWIQLGSAILGENSNDWSGVAVSMSADGQMVAIGAHGHSGNSGHVRIYCWTGSTWSQLGADIDGEAGRDWSGWSVSTSADGETVAIGAHGHDGSATDSGHVRIYRLTGSTWSQLGSDIDGENEGDYSGVSVSMSADGQTVAIGAERNDGNGSNAGHVRIYRWSGSAWTQLGTDINGEAAGDGSGFSVSISADGQMVAIGAWRNDGNGIDSGHVRIYRWSGSVWSQLGTDIQGEAPGDNSGGAVSMSADGQTVAIGAWRNDGNGIDSGHVRIYRWSGSAWSQLGAEIDGEAADDSSGGTWHNDGAVSMSADGQTVAIGAEKNDGSGTDSGHVRIYQLLPTVDSLSTLTDTISITVDPVNDAPTAFSLSAATILENAPAGITVGTFSTMDPDSDDSFTYTLVSGPGDTDNLSFEVVDHELRTKEVFNYEEQSSHTIRVRSTDSSGLTLEQAITLAITDLNEGPQAINWTHVVNTLPADADTRTPIKLADVMVADDALGEEHLSLSGPWSHLFELAGDSLYLKKDASLDFETGTVIPVTVSAADFSVPRDADFSSPVALTVAGRADTTGLAWGIDSSPDGQLIYVADRDSGLQIYDVSSSSEPVRLGGLDTPGSPYNVLLAPSGTTVYLADFAGGLHAIDVSDPRNPLLQATIATGGRPHGLAMNTEGTRLLVADWEGGLRIFDASNTNVLPEIGSLATAGNASGIALSADGQTAFVAAWSGVDVIDISDPSSPTRLHTVTTPGEARDIVLSTDGKYAFVGDHTSESMQVLDISSPATAAVIASLDTGGTTRGITLSPNGELAYVSAAFGGVAVVDITNPFNPTIIANSPDVLGLPITSTFLGTRPLIAIASDFGGIQIVNAATNGDVRSAEFTLTVTTATTSVVHQPISLSGIANLRLQGPTLYGAVDLYPEGNVILGGVPFAIPAGTENAWSGAAAASSGTVSTEIPLAIKGAKTVYALINTMWGERSPGTFATVTFVGSEGFEHSVELDGNDHIRDHLWNTWTNTLVSPIARNVFVAGSGQGTQPTNQVRLDMQAFDLPEEFQTQELSSVRLSDRGGNFFQRLLLSGLTVERLNEAPTAVALSAATVAENVATGTVVGTFSTTDSDNNDSFTYTLVNGDGDTGNPSFEIVGNELRATGAFDYESQSVYSIRVRSTDAGSLFREAAFSINVSDVNESPIGDLLLSNFVFSEALWAGGVIGQLIPIDDFETTINVPPSRLAGTVAEGTWVLRARLDTPFGIVSGVRLTDSGSGAGVGGNVTGFDVDAVRLSSIEINDASEIDNLVPIDAFNFTATGTTLTAGTQTGGTGSSLAGTINGSVDFAFATLDSFDRRDSPLHGLVSLGNEGTVYFDVNNLEVASKPAYLYVGEGVDNGETLANGISVTGFLRRGALDDEITFEFSLVAGTGDTDNDSFDVVGNELRLKDPLDHEARSEYSIRVAVSDSLGMSFEKAFTLTVVNANEAPAAISLSATSIPENMPAGTTVGSLTTTDPDSDGIFTYTLVSGDGDTGNSSFVIVGNELRTAAAFDYEAQDSYAIRVRTTDAGGLSMEDDFVVTVENLRDTPHPAAEDDFGIINGIITSYYGNGGDIAVPAIIRGQQVQGIGSFAFEGTNPFLTSIVIPEGVTSIGRSAFEGCQSLVSITLPSTLTTIGDWAFADCASVTGVVIPEGVTSIGQSAFARCTSLTSIVIPEGVTNIGGAAFANCQSLVSITLPTTLTAIGDWAFAGCASVTSIVIPEGITSIGRSVFEHCQSLASITLPSTLTTIGDWAFADCASVTGVVIPEGVTSIGQSAFARCTSLTSIVIPEGVTNIGGAAFANCQSLVSITLPTTLTAIGDWAFAGCASVTSIVIPEGITSIGRSVFEHCQSLASITLPSTLTAIGDWAFADCASVTGVVIPEGVTSIGQSAFERCTSLTSIVIPEGVTNIGGAAFANCQSLVSITLPTTLTAIGDWAFAGCASVTSIVIPEGITSIGRSVFEHCQSLASITLPSTLTTIGDWAFADCASVTGVVIPEGVTSIGQSAFARCTSLTSIVIPEGVTNIGGAAFASCESLASITLTSTLTAISDSAFAYCHSLNSITLPEDSIPLHGFSFETYGPSFEAASVTVASSDLQLIPEPLAVLGNPGRLTFSIAPNRSGTATITLTIVDSGEDNNLATTDDNSTHIRIIEVTVLPANDQPTADALLGLTIAEDTIEQSVTISNVTAGPHENQPLRVTASSSNTGLIPTPTVTYASPDGTGSIAFAPAADQHGTATITVTVEDGGLDGNLTTTGDNGTFSQTFDVTVTSVNDEPTLDALPNLLLEEDSPVQLIRLAGLGAGGGEQQFTRVSIDSSNPGLISNFSISYLPDLGQNSGLLAFSPKEDHYGVTVVTVSVEDPGLDDDFETAGDNLTFSQSFTVTVTPDGDENDTPTPLLSRMFIHEVQPGSGLASHQLPAINAFGEPLNGLEARITATSADTGLIPDPTVIHTTTDVPGAIAFSPVAGAYGTTVITLTVEDGGADNDLTKTDDNRTASHQVEVTVLRVIAEGESATLGADGDENLYANTLPVTLDGQQAGTTINGFAAFGAESTESGNSVLVQRAGAEYRLVSENTWEIIGMFDSLRNRTRRVLGLESRGVNHIAEISLLAGAFAVAGQESPDLIVRRGQTYVFDLNIPDHPFYLQTTSGGYVEANVYSEGFQGNGHTYGRHEWVVPADAPDELFYQSGLEAEVFGKIIVVD